MKAAKVLVTMGIALVVCTVVFVVVYSRHENQPDQTGSGPVAATQPTVAGKQLAAAGGDAPSSPPVDRQMAAADDATGSERLSQPAAPADRNIVRSTPADPAIVPRNKPGAPKPRPELQDPMARKLLELVGSNPDAEAYWLRAIFDTSLSDKERDDLIEDLNEDGLSDPRNPGPQDRKLIISRMIIIEEIMPYADDVMRPHLEEAYKDLKNLLAITEGGGEPVR